MLSQDESDASWEWNNGDQCISSWKEPCVNVHTLKYKSLKGGAPLTFFLDELLPGLSEPESEVEDFTEGIQCYKLFKCPSPNGQMTGTAQHGKRPLSCQHLFNNPNWARLSRMTPDKQCGHTVHYRLETPSQLSISITGWLNTSSSAAQSNKAHIQGLIFLALSTGKSC